MYFENKNGDSNSVYVCKIVRFSTVQVFIETKTDNVSVISYPCTDGCKRTKLKQIYKSQKYNLIEQRMEILLLL